MNLNFSKMCDENLKELCANDNRAMLRIGETLRDELLKYGFKKPDDALLGTLVKMLKTQFWYFRLVDIKIAMNAAANNKLDVKMDDYGQPLSYPTMSKIFREYRKRHNLFFQKKIAECGL